MREREKLRERLLNTKNPGHDDFKILSLLRWQKILNERRLSDHQNSTGRKKPDETT